MHKRCFCHPKMAAGAGLSTGRDRRGHIAPVQKIEHRLVQEKLQSRTRSYSTRRGCLARHEVSRTRMHARTFEFNQHHRFTAFEQPTNMPRRRRNPFCLWIETLAGLPSFGAEDQSNLHSPGSYIHSLTRLKNAGPTPMRHLRGVPNGNHLFRTTHTVVTTSYVHLRKKNKKNNGDSLTAAVYCVN